MVCTLDSPTIFNIWLDISFFSFKTSPFPIHITSYLSSARRWTTSVCGAWGWEGVRVSECEWVWEWMSVSEYESEWVWGWGCEGVRVSECEWVWGCGGVRVCTFSSVFVRFVRLTVSLRGRADLWPYTDWLRPLYKLFGILHLRRQIFKLQLHGNRLSPPSLAMFCQYGQPQWASVQPLISGTTCPLAPRTNTLAILAMPPSLCDQSDYST